VQQQQLEADEKAAAAKASAEFALRRGEKAALAAENQQLLAARRAARERERDADRAALEQVLAAHRQETQQKLVDKRQMRVERLEYMDFLRQRRDEEKRLEAELDRITQAALDRDNAKRDMVMLKEELARAELMKQVKQARHDQLNDKSQYRAALRSLGRGVPRLASPRRVTTHSLSLHGMAWHGIGWLVVGLVVGWLVGWR
jgi:hypothetical protein